jgi:hypothetical protein
MAAPFCTWSNLGIVREYEAKLEWTLDAHTPLCPPLIEGKRSLPPVRACCLAMN